MPFCRAESNLSFWPARTWFAVSDGVVLGAGACCWAVVTVVVLRRLVATCSCGRRGARVTRGAVTVTLGNWVALSALGAGACASAAPSRLTSSSAAALQAAATDLEGSDMVPDFRSGYRSNLL